MGKDSGIQWTHHTFNPHWGCTRVSPGCENCYAETLSHRLGFKVWGVKADRREFGDKHWAEPLKWNAAAEKAGERHRVFCASMADVFEDHPVAERSRLRLWPLIDKTPWLDWLLLTKRPENMICFSPLYWRDRWPVNAWAGCTVEDQQRFSDRYRHLLAVPASVRFFSMEPLLGAVDIRRALGPQRLNMGTGIDRGVTWVILGGESGHCARMMDLEWPRDLIRQCHSFGAAAFVKQLGEKWARGGDAEDSHGGDPAEWPPDLRVRRFPDAARRALTEPPAQGSE